MPDNITSARNRLQTYARTGAQPYTIVSYLPSFKFQIVGSLLRPSELLKYKMQIEHRDGISYPFYEDFAGYETCEAESIKDVVNKEIEHGLSVITDGEYSKSMWHLDFVWGFEGAEREEPSFYQKIQGVPRACR